MLGRAVVAALLLAGMSASPAWAMPAPGRLAEIRLRVDLRNVVGPEGAGYRDAGVLARRLTAANRVWSQCGIRFVPRSIRNVSSEALGVRYEPRSQGDLSTLATRLNPHGYTAIPLTVAGPWKFFDPGSGLYLHGLGWVFMKGPGEVDRIGAMISSQKLDDPHAGALIGHELGHALGLGHSPLPDNVMAGGDRLTPDQCFAARSFAESGLVAFRSGSRSILPISHRNPNEDPSMGVHDRRIRP